MCREEGPFEKEMPHRTHASVFRGYVRCQGVVTSQLPRKFQQTPGTYPRYGKSPTWKNSLHKQVFFLGSGVCWPGVCGNFRRQLDRLFFPVYPMNYLRVFLLANPDCWLGFNSGFLSAPFFNPNPPGLKYLEPKWPLFWLKRALFRRVQPPK